METSRLEQELQAELHAARNQGAGGLPQRRICYSIVGATAVYRQQEIGPVEHVERVRLELQVKALGEVEHLGEGHIGLPLSRANKVIPPKVTRASQAWRAQRR